jgi:hypothetical protein
MNPVIDWLIFVIAFIPLVRQNWAPPAEPESQFTSITAALGRESAEVLTLSTYHPKYLSYLIQCSLKSDSSHSS